MQEDECNQKNSDRRLQLCNAPSHLLFQSYPIFIAILLAWLNFASLRLLVTRDMQDFKALSLSLEKLVKLLAQKK